MHLELTSQQESDRADFRAFVDGQVVPHADRYDRECSLPETAIQALARERYFVATLPHEAGGRNLDMMTYGLLTEEIGRGCGSIRNLIAVQGMVAHAIQRWGSPAQKAEWVPRIGHGEAVAAFALTEPDSGSDAGNASTTATLLGNEYVLNGCKKWISFGQRADIFLVFAKDEDKLGAFLVERDTPGFSIEPISGMLGLRASMLGALHMNECRIPKENLVGKVGFGMDFVATTALDYGRYSTAWGCVGIAQGSLEASQRYTRERKQFDVPIRNHQLVQQMLTDMIANTDAARLLCQRAGHSRDKKSPDAIRCTMIAKYFASTAATRIASDAVQLHGANGCGPDYPVQRYLRDAKIQEIIEGSSQIQQIKIAELTQPPRQSRATGSK